MNNVIEVSQQFKDLTKDEANKMNHIFKVYNLSKGELDITDYVEKEGFRMLIEKESLNAKANSNEVNLDINLQRHKNIDIATIIGQGDIIYIEDTFKDETIRLFTGFVDDFPTTHDNTKHSFSIGIYDKLKDGVKAKFKEEEVWVDFWLSNNLDKSNSLAHQLAYKMGFTDYEIAFEDITDEAGNPLVGKYRVFEEGVKVFDELRLLVEAVCGSIFVDNEGLLKLTTPFNEDDYDDIGYSLEQYNILGEIQEEDIIAEHDGIKVQYSTFELQERKVIWQYINQESYDEENDLAKIRIRAGQRSAWIEFSYIDNSICLEVFEDEIEVLFEDSAGNEVNINYEVLFNQVGGKVRFYNPYSYDVIIQRFKMYGKPLTVYSDNKIEYSEVADPINLYSYDNPYLQTKSVALLNARHNFRLRCNNRTRYKLKTPILPFLALLNRLDINSIDITNKAVVERIEHDLDERNSNLELISFVPYTFNDPVIQETISRKIDLKRIIDDTKINQISVNLQQQIDSFSDDSLITKIEANGLRNNFEQLQAEVEPIIERAKELGIITEKNHLKNTIDELQESLNPFISEEEEILYPVSITETQRYNIRRYFADSEGAKTFLESKIKEAEIEISEKKAEERINKLSKANRAIQPNGSLLFHFEDSLTSTTGEIAEIVDIID